MKTVLIITHVSGFLLKFEVENVKLLQELGYTVHFASNKNEIGYPFEPKELKELGVIFHHIDIARSPYMFRMNKKALHQLISIINEEKIELIHCHTPVGGMLGRLAAVYPRTKIKPKVIYTAHGFHFYKGAPFINNTAYYFVERLLARCTDVLVVINEEDYRSASSMKLRKGGKVFKIPGVGLNTSVFKPVEQDIKIKLREENGIPKDAFLILSVGELNQNKNHRIALLAMKKLKNRKNVYYGICGDGFYYQDIKRYVEKLNISDRVFIWGYKRNIVDYYAMADITLFPSRREGLGMAGIESLAMGIPVLAADNRGTREYMLENENGFVFPYDDAEGFKSGIDKMLNMSEEEMACMKAKCVESISRFQKEYVHVVMKEIYGFVAEKN